MARNPHPRAGCRNTACLPVRAIRGPVLLAACLMLAAPSYAGGSDMAQTEPVIRTTHGDGRWFPGNPGELQSMISQFIERAQPMPAITGRIVSAIAPHAGYIYSGPVAGYTFRAIRDNIRQTGNQPDTVIVIGFSHRGAYPGIALLDGDHIQSPLGRSPLDRKAGQRLVDRFPAIRWDPRPHNGEHSAENLIPFVQGILPKTPLVVALMGDHSAATVEGFVKALETLAGEQSILVISSTDLLHDPDYQRVRKTDQATLDIMARLDTTALAKRWSPDEQVCCGIGTVQTAMRFASSQGGRQGTLLHYRNSGDDFPESRGSWVVGYGAMVFAIP